VNRRITSEIAALSLITAAVLTGCRSTAETDSLPAESAAATHVEFSANPTTVGQGPSRVAQAQTRLSEITRGDAGDDCYAGHRCRRIAAHERSVRNRHELPERCYSTCNHHRRNSSLPNSAERQCSGFRYLNDRADAA
jgi:hypothetical protein